MKKILCQYYDQSKAHKNHPRVNSVDLKYTRDSSTDYLNAGLIETGLIDQEGS